MANLTAYLNFSIILDKSVTPAKVRFIDTSSYPVEIIGGITGTVLITQPDGITATGEVIFNGVLTSPEVEYRMDTEAQPQCGQWTVKYTARHDLYDDSVLQRTFTLPYVRPEVTQLPDLNVFTPNLSVQDGTNYFVTGMTLQNVTRSWSVVVVGLGNISAGNVVLLNLALSGVYYDADYTISLESICNWVVNSSTWVTVRDKLLKANAYSVDKPPTLQALLLSLNDFKAIVDQDQCCNNPEMQLAYAYAESLYSHILKRGCSGLTSGLDAYARELIKIFNNGTIPGYVNTNLALTPYDWTNPCGSGSVGEVNTVSNIGSGEGLYSTKVGVDFKFKSLLAGSGVTLTSTSTEIIIASTNIGENNAGSNIGVNGIGLYIGKDGSNLLFRKLHPGTGISISTDSGGEVVISSSNNGEINVGDNVGTGIGLYKDKAGANLRFKTLKSGDNIIITETANEITIGASTNSVGQSNTGSNVGAGGVGVFDSKSGVDLRFRKLLGSNGVKVEQLPDPNTNIIGIIGPGIANVGTGLFIYKEFDSATNTHRFRRLKAGANISLSYDENDIVVSAGGSSKDTFTLSTDGSRAIPIGVYVKRVLVKSSSNLPGFKGGTSSGAEDIISTQPNASGEYVPYNIDKYYEAAGNIHFGGITSSTQFIIFYE